MATTLQKQIAEMETRCAQLEELQKLFEKMVKNEFGIDAKKSINSSKKMLLQHMISSKK